MDKNYINKKIIDGKNSDEISPNDDEEILKNKEKENKVPDDKKDSKDIKNENKEKPVRGSQQYPMKYVE